jgi:hypothetical protein
MAYPSEPDAMRLPQLFTWQFSVRQRSFGKGYYFDSSSSTLLSDCLSLTVAGNDLKNARAQSFVPPKQLVERKGVFYVSSKTGNQYETIQEMILKEEPTISSDSGFVFTGNRI